LNDKDLPPHCAAAYPPKTYCPDFTKTTVGPLLSQKEWNVLDAHPLTEAL